MCTKKNFIPYVLMKRNTIIQTVASTHIHTTRCKKTKMIMLSRTWRKEAGRRERELFSSQQGFRLAKQPTPLKVVAGEKEQCVQQGDRHCTGDKYKIVATTECLETEQKNKKHFSFPMTH